MELPDKIFLIGMPGSGKSTFGKKLAQELYKVFIDLDREIEKSIGKTIPEIFSDQGEPKFRDIEKETLHQVVEDHEKFLLATGGGAPCFFDNIDFMKSNGLVIFLDQALEHIRQRVIRKKSKRPLIEEIDDAELAKELGELYKKRLSFYKKANLVLSHDEINLDSAIKKLYGYDN